MWVVVTWGVLQLGLWLPPTHLSPILSTLSGKITLPAIQTHTKMVPMFIFSTWLKSTYMGLYALLLENVFILYSQRVLSVVYAQRVCICSTLRECVHTLLSESSVCGLHSEGLSILYTQSCGCTLYTMNLSILYTQFVYTQSVYTHSVYTPCCYQM